MKRKLIAMLLVVAMVVMAVPTFVFAADEPKRYDGGRHELNLDAPFSANGCDGAIQAINGAELIMNSTSTVNGEQCPDHDGYGMTVWAIGNGTKVIINSGSYTNEADEWTNDRTHVDLIYASNGANIEITGGEFKCATPKWTLNCKDKEGSKITVSGGKFYQFDPSNANVGAGEVVVASGYQVVQNGDWYEVVPIVPPTVTISDPGEITVGVPTEFTISTTAGSKEGTTVIGTSTCTNTDIIEKVEYYEVRDGKWYELTGNFGGTNGFPLGDFSSKFRVTFKEAGSCDFEVQIKDKATNEVLATDTATFTALGDEHKITVKSSSKGKITAPATAKTGDTVELTVIAYGNYILDYFTVDGKKIEDNSFVMPDKDVVVAGVYKYIGNSGGYYPPTTDDNEDIDQGITDDPTIDTVLPDGTVIPGKNPPVIVVDPGAGTTNPATGDSIFANLF